MPWPWVRRREYDRVVEQGQACERARHELATLAQRDHDLVDSLLEKYHALRWAGAEHPVARVALPVAQRTDLQDAIELMAGADTSLARHLHRFAKQQALDGVGTLDIVQQILHWQDDVDDGETGETHGHNGNGNGGRFMRP